MAKAQTDIRTTSYDVNQANAFGYVGTIEDALAQIRAETQFPVTNRARAELEYYLGVKRAPSAGPSVELDEGAWYGEPDPSADKQLGVNDPGFYGLANAKARGWLRN